MAEIAGPEVARRLFAPIADHYQRWAAMLSLGQDGRWRRAMVSGLGLAPDSLALDVAAGTGSISRLLEGEGHRVVALDLSPQMLARHSGRCRVLGMGDRLPFPDGCFGGVTFGYLLRYVVDPLACLGELVRVTAPGGRIGMVEFGLPGGSWYWPWRFYAGSVLPLLGRLIDPAWAEVGRFLRPSIESFHRQHPDLEGLWRRAGLVGVETRRPSLGGGLVMWGTKP